MKFLEDVSLSAYVTHATLLDSHDRAYTARAVDPALRRTHAVPWTSRHPLRVLFPFILPRFKVIPKGHTVFPSPVRARLTSKPTHIKHSLNAFLSAVNVGDYVVHGQLEAYSCKLAGIDKKLSKSLDQEVVTMMAGSPSALSVSPVGPLTDAGSRKTLIFLILTLNHMYPDYDFSALRGHHFTKENVSASFGGTSSLGESQPSTSAQSIVQVTRVKNEIDGFLLESARVYSATVGAGAEPLASELWRAIDQSIALVDCDVYTYKAVAEGDPFCDDGNLWSFNYFFYNRKLKRILYFSCRAVSKTADEESVYENSDDDLSRPARDDSFLAEGMEMDEDLY